MKPVLLAAAAAGLTLLPALAHADERKTLDVAPFHGIEVSSGIHAQVEAGILEQAVVATAPDANTLRDLRYDVRDGVLRFWIDRDLFHILDFSDRHIEVRIEAGTLDRLAASSGSEMNAVNVEGDTLGVEVSSGASATVRGTAVKSATLEAASGGSLEVAGTCQKADVEVSSGASIAGKDLDCQEVSAEASSGAWADITARQTLSAEASSGGRIEIFGTPRIDHQETTSGGSITITPHD